MCPCKEPPKYYTPWQKNLTELYSILSHFSWQNWKVWWILCKIFFDISCMTLLSVFFSLKKRFFVEKKIVDFCTQAKHAIKTAVSTMYQKEKCIGYIFFACSKASKLFMSDFPSLRQLSALWKMQPLYL